MTESRVQTDRLVRLEQRFVEALDTLEAASRIGKGLHQNHVYEMVLRLLKEPGGPEALYRHAPRFDAAGVFAATDWAQPTRLRPEFVAQALHQRGLTLAVECLSELRFLAIASGDYEHPDVTPEEARDFLESVLGLNLDLLFPGYSEASRIVHAETPDLMNGVQRLFQLLVEALGSRGILSSIVGEAERILRQRPVMVRRVRTTLATAAETIALEGGSEVDARAAVLIRALYGPTDLSSAAESLEAYAASLRSLDEPALIEEAEAFGDAMWATGLVAPQHAVLLRYLNEVRPDLLGHALRVESVGMGALALHGPLVSELIDVAVHPETAQCIHGLANLLVTGDLFFPPIAPSLRRLMGMQIAPHVGELLQQVMRQEAPLHALSPHSILLAGTLSVMGQPLGIGQGDNPTCQAARAISLWAQVDGGYLLELLAQAARDDSITMHFEGQSIRSDTLPAGMAAELHTELDPVSLILVPHLDRIYAEMSRQVADRGGDGHRWINPEFHGWWVYRGFALALDITTQAVTDFDGFIRLFFASYHPDYRAEAEFTYPQPIGIASTDHHGAFLGWHAISIQRVAPGADGQLRVYFYNPNNDGGQNWGQGIVTSTGDHHEVPGESSLPFHEFASRLYLFHYNAREHGDPAAVPEEDVARITELARASWGASFSWMESR
jgi:hypothetical protein